MIVRIPAPDDVTTPWWEATRERRFLVQSCSCGGVQHPPRAICIHCGLLDGLDWTQASGLGSVDSWTAVHRSADPDADLPYVIARVRVAEGPLLLTRLIGSPAESWVIGEAVVLDWLPAEDGRALPVFRRSEA